MPAFLLQYLQNYSFLGRDLPEPGRAGDDMEEVLSLYTTVPVHVPVILCGSSRLSSIQSISTVVVPSV